MGVPDRPCRALGSGGPGAPGALPPASLGRGLPGLGQLQPQAHEGRLEWWALYLQHLFAFTILFRSHHTFSFTSVFTACIEGLLSGQSLTRLGGKTGPAHELMP